MKAKPEIKQANAAKASEIMVVKSWKFVKHATCFEPASSLAGRRRGYLGCHIDRLEREGLKISRAAHVHRSIDWGRQPIRIYFHGQQAQLENHIELR